MKNKTLCLVMIVKNESKIIQRCLDSVKDIIDYYIICDTGSSDNTIELIQSSLKNVSGEIHSTEWLNFSKNRNEALNFAKNKADYALLLDADMIVKNYNFNKNHLNADAYYIHYEGNLDYAQILLINNRLSWQYVGTTHEYLHGTYDSIQNLHTLKILHLGDGGCKEEKFTRDINLLKQGIIAEPTNSRYYFYLANSYKDIGNYTDAIDMYKKRITLGGWEEEVFYSKYMIGYCFEMLQKFNEAILAYLTAWNYRPTRAEPLYRLAVLHRIKQQYYLSYLYVLKGLELAYPKDILFIHKDVYQYLLLMEKSIAAYWIKNYQESIVCCRQLDKMPNLPPSIKQQNHINKQYALHANRKFDKNLAYNTLELLQGLRFKNIMWFPIAGTLLGLIREKNFLEYDDDIDIGIIGDEQSEQIKQYLIKNNMDFYGEFGIKGKNLQYRFFYNQIQIDIFFFYPENDKYYMTAFDNNGRAYKYIWDKFTLTPYKFQKLVLLVPNNPEKFLETQYGLSWRIPQQTWHYLNDAKNKILFQ